MVGAGDGVGTGLGVSVAVGTGTGTVPEDPLDPDPPEHPAMVAATTSAEHAAIKYFIVNRSAIAPGRPLPHG